MFINPLHILRFLQFCLAVIIIGAYGYVASWYNSSPFLIPTPASIAFVVFTAVWTILIILPYTTFAPRYFPKIAHKYPMLVAETSTCLLWFSGFVATADLIRKLDVCRGAVCHAAIAGTVFAAFQFALFAASSYFAIRHISSPSTKDDDMDESLRSGSLNLGERKWWRKETAGAERI